MGYKIETKSETFDAISMSGDGPKWLRSALILGDRVFLPGMPFFGSDLAAALCGMHDGEMVTCYLGKAFVDSEFLAKEFAEFADEIRQIRKKVLDWHSSNKDKPPAVEGEP